MSNQKRANLIFELQKVIIIISISILVLFQIRCDWIFNDDKTNVSQVDAFKDGRLALTAGIQIAWPDSLITLKMECLPLFNGKGGAILQLISGDTVFISSPVVDTLGDIGFAHQAEFRSEYFANQTFELEWQILLREDITGYAFEGYVYLDSIRVDSVFYHIESDSVKNLLLTNSRLGSGASTGGFLYLSPPPNS